MARRDKGAEERAEGSGAAAVRVTVAAAKEAGEEGKMAVEGWEPAKRAGEKVVGQEAVEAARKEAVVRAAGVEEAREELAKGEAGLRGKAAEEMVGEGVEVKEGVGRAAAEVGGMVEG